ncbi:MAG: hypothetical protein M1429_01190 [Patescibacteria group bacterium]|nr:hypothetical protein [Patescibacteria group bacterium]
MQDKIKAIELRKQGYSYNEIKKIVPNLSKSTLSSWVKNVELSYSQKQRILSRVKNGLAKARIKGAWANKIKSKIRIKNISQEAQKEFAKLAKKSLFLIGMSLYWAEGSKKNRRFEFINSDPEMISLMMRWLREICQIRNDQIIIRIYIHEFYKNENCEKFWAEITGLSLDNFASTVYKPTPHLIKRNKDYKGCCRIEVRGSELFWKVMAWQKLIINL